MLVKRRPKIGETLKINPEFRKVIMPEIPQRDLNYEECWNDSNITYLITHHIGSEYLFKSSNNNIFSVWIDRNGFYMGFKEELKIPMFITLDHSPSKDPRYCQCGPTSYRNQVMFNSVVKICQQCGKDKKE